uniref:Ground-like domain-containing protein n=1 Tax=Meloidogyne incognita TaxID=6306 RepID=A0A914KMU6_MELIC
MTSRVVFCLVSLGILICLASLIEGIGFPGGGGGGGGCGGGCGGGGGGCSSCGGGGGGCGGGGGGGCCGRRKRETAVQPHYKADDTPCPQVAWKQLLEDGINENDAIASVNSIQTALFRRYETEQKFLVVCATADEAKAGDATANKVHFSSSGDGYCNVVKKNIWCQAVALSA